MVAEGVRLKEALHTCEQIENLAEIGKSVDIDAVQKRIIENEEVLSKMSKERNGKLAKIEMLGEQIRVKTRNLEALRKEAEMLKEKCDAILNGPQEECRKCVEELLKFSAADLKTLTKIQKPSLGIRLCCEMLRTIFEAEFVPKKNAAENWLDSQKFLLDKTFLIKLATLDAEKLTVNQMKMLKKYVDRVEFNANRIEHESLVCASLCRWIGAFLELACTLRLMEEQNDEAKDLRAQISEIEKSLNSETTEKSQLTKDVDLLSSKIRENEQILTNDRRLCDYRLRSGDLLMVLEPFKIKWRNCQKMNEKLQNEMIGNTVLFSIYRTMLLSYDRSISQVAIGLCTAHLTKSEIPYDSSTVTPSNIIQKICKNLRNSRRFCLFLNDQNDVILNFLRQFLTSPNCIDLGNIEGKWTDLVITQNLPKYVYSVVPTIFYNFETLPPAEMFEVLMKSEEKEICYRGKPLELPEDILFVFIAKHLDLEKYSESIEKIARNHTGSIEFGQFGWTNIARRIAKIRKFVVNSWRIYSR
ncbi:unnamed protein product [Caenorhabditis angaria]|uniref:Uncharacterized protein n=1 Tax=Caenorhabditis angaria TaxID=860376 RepID=A0A9P1MZ57_9PELO|nr:unnamed protein product [Caenorhabditis angaria]